MPLHATRTLSVLLFVFICFAPLCRAGEFTLESAPFGDFADSAAQLFPGFGAQKNEALLAVSLVPESNIIAPGKPFALLVVLNHAPGAYSYWTNPGGPGVGTAVDWTLPEGFSIEGPEWPAPELYQNGGMNFYIYKNRAALAYTVTPPEKIAPGTNVTLRADINTQACTSRTCTPLRLQAEARVIAAAEPGKSDPAVAAARKAVPGEAAGWRFEIAADSGHSGEVVLEIIPETNANPEAGANPEPGNVYFFDSRPSPLVDSQKPQTLEKNGNGWRLRIPLLPNVSQTNAHLTGVIHAENGWLANPGTTGIGGSPHDFRIDPAIPQSGENGTGGSFSAAASGLPPGVRQVAGERLWALLLFAFLGGLLLNVMPCVFPVIGLKIMGFARQAHKDRRSVFLHGVAYATGVLLCFWALALLVITMGRGWGAQLQSDWFLFALCHIFLIMSMNMAGVFDVGAIASGAGQTQGREGLKRSFLTGLLATLTSTPCSAPFLGTALAYALSLPPLLSTGVFTLMGLGFAFPYLALSLFPNQLKRLPKPGPWMDTFRQAMCFPLFATTAYLFWTMEAMVAEWQFLMLLFGLVLTAMACWLYGKRQKSLAKRPGMARILMALAVVSLLGGIWLGMPSRTAELEWRDWSPETVAELRREGRPVYVDFTARWCATCQLNKRVYLDDEVKALIQEKNVALVKADWTLYDERITATLRNEFNKAAIPVTAIYAPGETKGTLLPDLLTAGNVSETLRALP